MYRIPENLSWNERTSRTAHSLIIREKIWRSKNTSHRTWRVRLWKADFVGLRDPGRWFQLGLAFAFWHRSTSDSSLTHWLLCLALVSFQVARSIDRPFSISMLNFATARAFWRISTISLQHVCSRRQVLKNCEFGKKWSFEIVFRIL